jgi:pimeloyl-ACP methyl ester carboxylesterase
MARTALRHLVVVVPGFGGSVLRDADGTPRWGPAFADIARSMVRADPLSVTASPDLAVAGVQRTVTVFPPFVLPGYDRLVRQIQDEYPRIRVDEVLPGRPRDLRADVVLFPYDFRHGVRPAALRLQAEIELRLGRLSRQDRNRRVIVIGHSMGGLVARYWLGPLGGAADCRALITLATPHRGVPKALDWLVNGVHIGRMQLRRMTEVSRDWQGVYDLLPQYPAILPVGADDAPGRRRSAIGPLEIGGIAAAGFLERAAAASDMHAEIDKAWRELGDRGNAPALAAVFARGHATPSRTVLADGKLTITKADPEWLPNAGWRGDGTVPAISAVPPELESGGTVLRQVPERHLPMAGTPAVTDLLKACDSEAPRPSFRHLQSRAWLGVAVDNVVAAGDPMTVVAEVLGGPAGQATQMWVRVAGAGRTDNFRCERAGDHWRAELPGQQAGLYSLAVSATQVPQVGQLRCSDMLEVVALP